MLMNKENNKSLLVLNKKIINCNICKRLKDFRTKVATEKRKMYTNETYWGKPITGFGDINGNFYNMLISTKLSLIIFMIIGKIELISAFLLIKKIFFKD